MSDQQPTTLRRRIWTSRYQNAALREGFESGRLATIGITQSNYRQSIEQAGFRHRLYKPLAPPIELPLHSQTYSRREYLVGLLSQLAELDPEEVYSDLYALADELLPGSTEIALLDFADLQDLNDYTHRIIVGGWLSVGLGIRVEEYPDER